MRLRKPSIKHYKITCQFELDARPGTTERACTDSVGRDSAIGIGLVTVWTVWGSNPGGREIFRIRQDRPWGPCNLL